jgi:hypothetical protein
MAFLNTGVFIYILMMNIILNMDWSLATKRSELNNNGRHNS